jgi:hypothetical protein
LQGDIKPAPGGGRDEASKFRDYADIVRQQRDSGGKKRRACRSLFRR